MSLIHDIDKMVKKQPGKRYRLLRQDKDNMDSRQYQGYEVVTASDPEVKGTPLEKGRDADSHVSAGSLVLGRISETRARELEKAKDEKLEKRMRSIREGYKLQGETIKRKLGSLHKNFNVIVEEEK